MPLSNVLVEGVYLVAVGFGVVAVSGASAAGPNNIARNWRNKDFTSVFAN